MDVKLIADEIKSIISADQVKAKIENDLGIKEIKGKLYVCFLHNDSEKAPNMSFDDKKKDFHCFRCGQHYNIFDHYMQHYGLGFTDALKAIINDFNLGIHYDKPKATKLKIDPIKHTTVAREVLEYIRTRGISDKTVNYLGIKMDSGNIVWEYRSEDGLHEANKLRPAKKYSKDEKKKFWWDGQTGALYNMDKIDITSDLVICEGEFDCMALIEAGYKNVVSVKDGAKSYNWIETNWAWLNKFESITLWYDNDDAGKEGVIAVSSRLENVSRIVYCDKSNDINELLYKFGADEVLKQLKNAKVLDVEGVITPSQIEEFNVYEAEKIKSGIKIIDKSILGFVMGSLNVITGYNGSGKSTLINQMCIAESISQGYKVFAFSGELTPSNFKYWLYSTLVDERDMEERVTKDNDKYFKVKALAEQQITEFIDDKLFLYNKMDYTHKTIIKTMKFLAMRKGVKVFVLDNLMKVELDEGRNEFLAQKKFVNELKMFAIKHNAIVHLVAHPRKPQMTGQKLNKFDVAGSGDITNLADYVIGIHRTTEEQVAEYEAQKEKGKLCIDPRDSTITLFKDRPTGSSEKEACLYFNAKRKRFYNNNMELDRQYGYTEGYKQTDFSDMPF